MWAFSNYWGLFCARYHTHTYTHTRAHTLTHTHTHTHTPLHIFSIILFFNLENNCSLVLCRPLPCTSTNQPQAAVPVSPPSWNPSHPILSPRLSQSTGLSALCHTTSVSYHICFTYGNAYVSMLLSQFVLSSPSPPASVSLFSMSASPLMPCK